MKARIAILSAALLAVGCSRQPEPRSVLLRVRVVGEKKQPLSGVPVALDGQRLGNTDARGLMAAPLAGPDGRRCRVAVACPEGRVAERGAERELAVRFLRRMGQEHGPWVPLDVGFACLSRIRKNVLAIRADGQSGLAVRALGRQIAVTDDKGFAQTVIEGAAGDEIELVLDTSGRPELRPQMPNRRLAFPATGQIFVFDQRFSLKRPDAGRPHRRYPGPRRI